MQNYQIIKWKIQKFMNLEKNVLTKHTITGKILINSTKIKDIHLYKNTINS